jgi:hypothetical protein
MRYIPIQEGEDWRVRDTEEGKTLLGYYSEQGAINTARRLEANINLSPNQMRAFLTLLSVGQLSAHRFYEQFKGKPLGSDGTRDGISLAKELESHGLVKVVSETVVATDWGYTWAGRKRLND